MKKFLAVFVALAMFNSDAFPEGKPRVMPFPGQPRPNATPTPGSAIQQITPAPENAVQQTNQAPGNAVPQNTSQPAHSLSQGQFRDVSTAGNRISFTMSGLDITRINKGYFISVKGETPEGKEVSFVMGALDARSVRLISHRVDSTCAPKTYCEAQDVNTGPRFEPSRRYDFELFWNGTFTRRNGEVKNLNNQVWMEVFEAGTKNSLMQWTVSLFGPMRAIKWARVGNGVEDGYGGMDGVITLVSHH
jgi:hypothetical protein